MDHVFHIIGQLLVAIPVIFIVITAHEFGHFLMARLFGVGVDEYSLGYGPELWKCHTRGRAKYTIRRYPVIGHVTLRQDDFDRQSFFKKTLIILAGPLFNMFLAFLILFLAFAIVGQPSKPPVYSAIHIGGVADRNGIEHGDRVVSVNGQAIERYEQVLDETYELPVRPLDIVIARDDDNFDLTITPVQVNYIDIYGMQRTHGRLMALVRHGPINLNTLKGINGIEVKSEDEARELALQHLGQDVVVSMLSFDDEVHDYKTYLDETLNEHLNDPDHDDYESFFLGTLGDNFYMQFSLRESVIEAGALTKKMMIDIAKMPFQLFPLDKRVTSPETLAYGDDTFIRNIVYRLSFFMAFLSVVIGYINLIPLPHFDGGRLLVLFYERWHGGKPITPQQKFWLLTIALGGLYIAIMAANVTKMPHYFDKKIKKVQELLDEDN